MGKLFEAVDKVNNFINEEIWAAHEVSIESIELHYGQGDTDMTWLDKSLIKAFNVFERETTSLGYLILPADDKFNAEGLTEYLRDDNLKHIIVNLTDGITTIYNVIWNVPFAHIDERTYIMLFECVND